MLGLVQLHASLRHLVPERLAEFQRLAAGNSHFERMARIHAACEQMVRGGPAAEVADEVEGVPRRRTTRGRARVRDGGRCPD